MTDANDRREVVQGIENVASHVTEIVRRGEVAVETGRRGRKKAESNPQV